MSQDTKNTCTHALSFVQMGLVVAACTGLVFLVSWLLAACVRPVPRAADEMPPAVWATDGEEPPVSVTRPMPATPFDGQKTPPCGTRDVAINGACWREMAKPPDPKTECGSDEFLHGGRCYLPVKKARRAPTSVEP